MSKQKLILTQCECPNCHYDWFWHGRRNIVQCPSCLKQYRPEQVIMRRYALLPPEPAPVDDAVLDDVDDERIPPGDGEDDEPHDDEVDEHEL